MASHYSTSNSTQSISNGTSPSSLFLHDLDSEAFEVSLLLGNTFKHSVHIGLCLQRRQKDLSALLGGESWDQRKTDLSGILGDHHGQRRCQCHHGQCPWPPRENH